LSYLANTQTDKQKPAKT